MQNFNFLVPIRGIATKTFILKNGKWELKSNYKAGKFFKGHEIPVGDLKEAYNILKENQKHSCFNITGAIIDGTDKKKMIRRKRSDHKDGLKPTITDRNLSLFCLDIDGYQGSINTFIYEELPEEFHTADYIYQYSSSYGLTSETTNLKCHLFFWLHDPVHNLDIREWVKSSKIKALDPSVLNAAQPIYIQKRICEDGEDPVKHFIGYEKKGGDLVWVPDIATKNTTPKRTKAKYDLSAGVEKILVAENYHDELNKLALSLINRKVPPGTVKQMLEGAMNAAPVKDDRWKERYEDIGRSVDSAAEIAGEPTIEEVIDWLSENTPNEIKAGFARKCIHLSPMDKTTAIYDISKKIGFGVADVKKTIKIAEADDLAEKQIAAQDAQTAERQSRGIYEIEVTPTNSWDVVEKTGTILAESKHHPQIFRSSGSLVYANIDIPKSIRQSIKTFDMGVDYPKVPIITAYRKPFYSLGSRIGKDIVFQDAKGQDIEPPTKIVHEIGEADSNKFKPLTGIVEHPFIDNNWKLVQKRGYDERTGLFTVLHHKLKIRKLPPKEAYQYLAYEVFDEFPFDSDLDRAVAVAALMTCIMRPNIAGDTGMPGFGIVSPIQSSGKTTLAQLISYSIFNRPVAATSWSDDDEEMGKHILAILQEGQSCVLFDNIRQGATIQSGRLANAMSNDIFSGRQLGENKTISVPSSVIWMFTGNGISFVGDFATRVYPISINPKMEDPNTRRFKRDDIGQWAMDNRKKIISAVLSIIIAGKDITPNNNCTRFKLWDKFVKQPLFKVSGIDINEAVKKNQMEDPLQQAKSNLIAQLFDVFGGDKFTTKDIIKQAYGAFEAGDTELGEALSDLFGEKAKNSNSLGRGIGPLTGMVLNGLCLKKKKSNIAYWFLIKVKNSEEIDDSNEAY